MRMVPCNPQLIDKPNGHCVSAPSAGNFWGLIGRTCLPKWAQSHTFPGAQGQKFCPEAGAAASCKRCLVFSGTSVTLECSTSCRT